MGGEFWLSPYFKRSTHSENPTELQILQAQLGLRVSAVEPVVVAQLPVQEPARCTTHGLYVCMSVVQEVKYEARPQSNFPTRLTASKPYIARSDCAYVTEQ
jgi:hypothetical protein